MGGGHGGLGAGLLGGAGIAIGGNLCEADFWKAGVLGVW